MPRFENVIRNKLCGWLCLNPNDSAGLLNHFDEACVRRFEDYSSERAASKMLCPAGLFIRFGMMTA